MSLCVCVCVCVFECINITIGTTKHIQYVINLPYSIYRYAKVGKIFHYWITSNACLDTNKTLDLSVAGLSPMMLGGECPASLSQKGALHFFTGKRLTSISSRSALTWMNSSISGPVDMKTICSDCGFVREGPRQIHQCHTFREEKR